MNRLASALLAFAVPGALLSIALVGTAQAEGFGPAESSFTLDRNRVVVGEPITVTDTTPNPEGLEFKYEWDTNSDLNYDIKAGDPECLNADCSQARWAYSSPIPAITIFERVSWISCGLEEFGECKEDGPERSIGAGQVVTVLPATDAPAPIILAGPPVRQLPSTLEFLTPKPYLELTAVTSEGCFTGNYADPNGYVVCDPYLVRRTGPDAAGLYHHVWRLPMAQPGPVTLNVLAWATDQRYGDYRALTFLATGNKYKAGDYRSCVQREFKSRGSFTGQGSARGGHIRDYGLFRFAYYARFNTLVVFKLQQKVTRKGKQRWVTRTVKRKEAAARTPRVPAVETLYRRRLAAIPFLERRVDKDSKGSTDERFPPQQYRVRYLVKHGKKVVKHGFLSRRSCRKVRTADTFGHPKTQIVVR